MLLLGVVASAQGKVVARINNVRNEKGVCQVCLYNSAAAFKGDGGTPVRCIQAPVKAGAAEAVFDVVPAGVYAVMVIHDANQNQKLDQNFFGMPKEGYGASQNRLPFAAAPTFDDNKFTVGDKTIVTLRIRLRNL